MRASIGHYFTEIRPVLQGRHMRIRSSKSKKNPVSPFSRLLRAGFLSAIALALTIFAAGPVAHATDAPKQAAPATHEAAPLPGDFAGSEACETCHADIAKGFDSNPHTRIAHMHGANAATCEGCHGPGKAHVDSGGDATKIFRFTKATPDQIDEKCLTCHKGNHANFPRSAHGEANVSCLNCHGVHTFKEESHLLKASQPTLCYGCHTDVKPDFAKPFHHKVDEGLMTCSDCHNPHGTF